MRLKQHINEVNRGSRGKKTDEKNALRILKQDCSKSWDYFVDKGESIFRGMNHKGDYYLIDPSKTTRKSQNADNYYTVIIDGHPEWKQYPKRSQSIICTNNKAKSDLYGGERYRVFPFNNSNIGVAPESDIWDSFSPSMRSIRNLDDFNSGLFDIWDYTDLYLDFSPDIMGIKKFSDMERLLDALDSALREKFNAEPDNKNYWPPEFSGNSVVMEWEKRGQMDFKKFVLMLFDPRDNGFYHTRDIKKALSANESREIWTDGKSLMISYQEAHYMRMKELNM